MKTTLFGILFFHLFTCSFAQDESSPAKKSKELISKLKNTEDYPLHGKDTLIDLNGDNFKDLLVEYYGMAGTGLKNRVTVYLYDSKQTNFKRCDQLCDLGNPNFDFDKKTVTGYYIANGGGYAIKLNGMDQSLIALRTSPLM